LRVAEQIVLPSKLTSNNIIIGLLGVAIMLAIGFGSAANPGLSFCLIASLLFAMVCLYDIQKSFILLVFLIPIIPNSLIIDLGAGTSRVFLYRILIGIYFVAFLVGVLLRRITFGWTAYHKVGILFLISMILNIVFSAQPLTSLKTVVAELWLTGLVFFFVSFHLADSSKVFRGLVMAAIASAVLVSIMGFYELMTGNSIEESALISYLTPLRGEMTIGDWGRGLGERGGLFRAQATMFHPLGLASYLLFIIPLVFEYAARGKGKWLWLLTIAGGLASTLSRAGWFIGCAILGIRLRRNVILVMILLIVTIFVMVPWYQKSGQEGSNMLMVANTDFARFIRLEEAIKVFKSNPLFGVGVGHLNIEIFSNVIYRSWDVTVACLLEENGLVGIGIWLAFFIYLAIRYYRLSNNQEFPMRWAATGIFWGIVASLINATFSNSIFQFSQGYLVMMALSGSLARLEWDHRNNA